MSGIASAALSDAQADQILAAVQKQVQITRTSPTYVQPGQPVTAAVVPSSPVIDASDLANGVLNLAWVTKDVLFGDHNPVPVPSVSDVSSTDGFDGDVLATAAGIADNQNYPPLAAVLTATTDPKTPGAA